MSICASICLTVSSATPTTMMKMCIRDSFQGLAAQVTNLHHVLLRGVDEILNRVDACALEAVEGTNGEVQLLDRHFKHLIVLRFSLFNNGGLGADLLGQVYEQIEVVAENLCACLLYTSRCV